MNNAKDHRTVLVIRPWLGSLSAGDAYAHFDAIAMREPADQHPRAYGDYEVLGYGDDGRKTLRLEHFRFQCQVDDRHDRSYAWRWGYRPSNGDVFSLDDLERYGASITAIKRALDRFDREDGPTETVGRFAVRLARVLKLDGIALLEISSASSFCSNMQVRRRVAPCDYGDAIRALDHLVLELHHACQQRTGKLAA